MRISIGNGGWIAVDGLGLPCLLYVRVRQAERRLRVVQVYLDGSESDGVDAAHLRSVPLSHIEAFVNDYRDDVAARLQLVAPDLATLASYYATSFGKADHWVAQSFAAQLPGGKSVPRARKRGRDALADSEFRLVSGPGRDGLTDEFLRGVARAYSAARDRGEKPNVSIAEQTEYPVKSVQRWVYLARQRGIMPRGQRGKVG